MFCDAVGKLDGDPRYADVIDGASKQLASIFENMFCHHRFTGRSGTFFAYEGLGSIYWHMVSKLALAAVEVYVNASQAEQDQEQLDKLREHIHEIRFGLGAEKNPAHYGAFPGDPYSHSPSHAGAQQPGMTGQVKEDILFRFAELGVRINEGIVRFDPALMQQEEMHQDAAADVIPDTFAENQMSQFLFLYSMCGVPIAYLKSHTPENRGSIQRRTRRRK